MQDAITISVGDVRRLTEGEFLNDSIIDMQIKRIVLEAKEKAEVGVAQGLQQSEGSTAGGHNASPVYAFSSMFYTKLTEIETSDKTVLHDKVKRWTKNVDIFSKEFIFIPINIGAHWSLVCVVRPGALIATDEQADHEEVPIPFLMYTRSY
jgi:sentrin-specific protease 7